MILNHGSNSLPRGNTLKLPYSLDIAAFDVDTLKDGDVQWSTAYDDDSKPVLTKEDGALSVKFERGPNESYISLYWDQFENVGAKYAVEIDFVSTSFNNFFFYGPVSFSLVIGSGSYFRNTGIFIYRNGVTNVYNTEGVFNWSNNIYMRYEGFDNTWPKTVKWVIDESNELVEIYFDNVLKMKLNSSVLRTMGRYIVLTGGFERAVGIVKVSGLRIYNVA